ncbi:MAG UNVERIFIED_CONTAM: winged helix-turn-helix domain-containing protein [Microcystis novacekii LVE1205-3]
MAKWMSELLGKESLLKGAGIILRGLDYVRRRPRPAHIESDPEEQEQWKKKFRRPLKK